MRPEEATVQELPSLDGDEMIAAFRLGVAEALRQHRAAGVEVVTWDDATQQVVIVPPDQIPSWIDDPSAQPPAR